MERSRGRRRGSGGRCSTGTARPTQPSVAGGTTSIATTGPATPGRAHHTAHCSGSGSCRAFLTSGRFCAQGRLVHGALRRPARRARAAVLTRSTAADPGRQWGAERAEQGTASRGGLGWDRKQRAGSGEQPAEAGAAGADGGAAGARAQAPGPERSQTLIDLCPSTFGACAALVAQTSTGSYLAS